MLIQEKENKMNVTSVSIALPDVVLDTCLVPMKKAAKEADDFFPASSPIPENIKKISDKTDKDEEAEKIGNLVGTILNYFG